jgi:hypothetical protein
MASLWLRQFVPAAGLSEAGLGLLALFFLYTAAALRAHLRPGNDNERLSVGD